MEESLYFSDAELAPADVRLFMGAPASGRTSALCELAREHVAAGERVLLVATTEPGLAELGASWSECTRCGECIKACPGDAIKLAVLVSGKSAASQPPKEVAAVGAAAEPEAADAKTKPAETAADALDK